MRPLRNGEEPVLPVGFQNLETGDNRDFNVFGVWGINKIENVSLIEVENPYENKRSLRLNISGHASQKATMFHDQTHNLIGYYRLVKEYQGTYPQIFKQIIIDTHRTKLPAYVYK